MNSSTILSKIEASPKFVLRSMSFFLVLFFTISNAKAQNISELNQFLNSQESIDLGLDRDYLLGMQSTAYLSGSTIDLPKVAIPNKLDLRNGGLSRISEIASSLVDIEILQLVISSDSEKSELIPVSVQELLPSLRVVIILSKVPVSVSEIEAITASFQNSSVKILYLFSEPA